AGLGVEAVLAAGVAHLLDRHADDAGKVDVAAGGDFAAYRGEAGRHQRFTGSAPHGVLRENGVENRIGDLIGDLVGVPFGHRLRSEQITTFTAHVSNRAPSRAGRSAGKTLKLYHIRHRWTRKNTETPRMNTERHGITSAGEICRRPPAGAPPARGCRSGSSRGPHARASSGSP